MADYRNLDFPDSAVWVPCIPNYATGELIPLYTINNFPSFSSAVPIKPIISRGGLKSKDWTQTEDMKLIELVNKLGTKKWAGIAKEINNVNENWAARTGKNCRERWYNHLNPEINKGEWSYEEDIMLLKEHIKYQNKWTKIAKALTGRTENAVKNRINTLLKKAKQTAISSYIPNEILINVLIEQFESLINVQSTESTH